MSIYSTDAEVHDQITRRRGSWEQSMKVLREMSKWPVPLNIKTPVFRLNTRTYYGVRDIARELGAENEVSCLLTPGADGDVSVIEQLQTRPEALRIILMDKLGKHVIPADGKADGYAFGSERGFPCSANSMISVLPSGVVRGCNNIPLTFGQVPDASLKEVILSTQRQQMIQANQAKAFPTCDQHDYCHVPCYAGESFEQNEDGTFTLNEIQGDGCLSARIRMELCRQIEQGIDPLSGKGIEECLAAQPVEEVPVFRKKASALANLIAIISLTGYIRKNSYIFRLHRPDKVCTVKMYRECFSIGVPMLISALLAPVLLYIMNTLIIDKLGADGMYIFTVYYQVNAICMLALSGSNTAISNIGGILIGEEDYGSLRLLMRRIFRLLTVVILVVSVLIFLFPDVLARIYGADDHLIEQCRTPFRLMTLTFLPNAFSETLGVLYFVQGHQKLCRWIEIVTNVGAIAIIALIAFYTPGLIWYILPVTAWLLLAVLVAMAYVVHRMNPLYDWPTLQGTIPTNPSFTFSVPYTIEGVKEFLAQVKPFIQACELNCGITVRVALEELLYEIVETHTSRKKDETFDIHIIDKETIFTVVLKSKGPLRNPIFKYADEEVMNLDRNNIRRAVLTRVCKDINHKYMNGINCIYLNYNRNYKDSKLSQHQIS